MPQHTPAERAKNRKGDDKEGPGVLDILKLIGERLNLGGSVESFESDGEEVPVVGGTPPDVTPLSKGLKTLGGLRRFLGAGQGSRTGSKVARKGDVFKRAAQEFDEKVELDLLTHMHRRLGSKNPRMSARISQVLRKPPKEGGKILGIIDRILRGSGVGAPTSQDVPRRLFLETVPGLAGINAELLSQIEFGEGQRPEIEEKFGPLAEVDARLLNAALQAMIGEESNGQGNR